ncbi:MAG TPA: hypothetical protein VIM86_04005 [Thermodesulfobacteriota bacterium]
MSTSRPTPQPRVASLPPSSLPGIHFAAAFGALVVGAAGLVWAAPDLAVGAYLSFPVIGVVHLFTLGFVTTSIMGVLYQFLPIGLGVGIRSERLAYQTFGLFAPGVLLFVLGTVLVRHALLRAGVALVAVAVLAFVLNLAATLARTENRNVTWWGLAVGAANLVAVLVLGLLLAANLGTGSLGAARLGAGAAHAHLALLGFVMPVVVGVGHKLLPMFLVAPGVDRRPAAAALVLLGAGAPLLAAGLGLGVRAAALAGAGLALAGLLAFVLQAALYFRRRRLPALDPAMRLAAFGVTSLALAAALAPAVLVRGPRAPGLVTAYGLLGLLGLCLFVVGHYYRIVPHFVWRQRYLSRRGEAPMPRPDDLLSRRRAEVAAVLLAAGLAVLAAAAAMAGVAPAALARAGALLFAAGAATVTVQMAGLALGRS